MAAADTVGGETGRRTGPAVRQTTSRGAAACRRSAFSLVEVMVALGLFGLLIGSVVWLFGFGGRSTVRLTGQMSLQQNSRKAVVRLLRELQEGMQVLSPTPGTTLSYALIRDKLSQVRWFYQVPQAGRSDVYDLVRYVHDPSIPEAKRTETLLQNVKRLTFTSRSEGALQVNLLLVEDEREFSLLTTVRLRNLASAEELW